MVDSTHPADDTTATICPWCSAAVTAETAVCPSCNAILLSDAEHDLPGVTAVDAALVRSDKKPPSRGRFLSWFSSERTDQPPTEAESQAIAPPAEDVQREILRLELEAHIANLQAEADSILSDALIEGRVDDLPEGLRPLATAEADAETPRQTADAMVAAATTSDAAESTSEAGDADIAAAEGVETGSDGVSPATGADQPA